MMKLLYCIVLSNNDELFDYDEFLEVLKNKKIAKEIINKFSKTIKLIEQFTTKQQQLEQEKTESENITELFIKDIAMVLIINAGIDVNYVMNELQITDIQMLMNQYNEKVKQEMESNRLWCYMSILPHIDSSKINTPSKFYSFPWDAVEVEKDENTISIDELNSMFTNGLDIINKINNKENN